MEIKKKKEKVKGHFKKIVDHELNTYFKAVRLNAGGHITHETLCGTLVVRRHKRQSKSTHQTIVCAAKIE